MPDQLDLFADHPAPEAAKSPEKKDLGPKILYFDLETQKSADDVGGWSNIHKMLLAVGVVWDSHDTKHYVYGETEAKRLAAHLKSADLVVGFNVKGFDYTVLQPYADFDLLDVPTFDMLEDVSKRLGHRLKLDNLATCTLGTKKSADGLTSLKWWKEYKAGDKGKLDMIIAYCKQDVNVTRDLFLFGAENGYVEYDSRSGKQRLEVDWQVKKIVDSLKG